MNETQRAAMQQALETLKFIPASGSMLGAQAEVKRVRAIAVLRAALAEPEPEPVADEVKAQALDALNRMQSIFMMSDGRHPRDVLRAFVQLASTPPARRPMTLEEIMDAVRDADLDWHTGWSFSGDAPNCFITLIRAAERAHGIGGNDE